MALISYQAKWFAKTIEVQEIFRYTQERMRATYQHQMLTLRQQPNSKSRGQSQEDDCLYDEKILDPNLWKELRHDLHYVVFPHLSINETFRLRSLNKTWKHDISPASFFYQNCDEAHPTILSYITQDIEVL